MTLFRTNDVRIFEKRPAEWLTDGTLEGMRMSAETKKEERRLKCPECRAVLKRRRTRTVSECEMVCGGCGRVFDICDEQTARALRSQA